MGADEPATGTAAAYDTYLSIGDIVFRIAADDRRLASAGDGPLAPFAADRGAADVEIRARWTDTAVEPSGDLLFDAGGAWRLVQVRPDFHFTFRSKRDDSIYKTARFNSTFTRGDVELSRRHFSHRSADAVYPLEYPLDELLMIHLLAEGRGVEIHGCAILDDAGRAYLFAGQSGAGKSTMARIWIDRPGVRVLSDERVVVRTDRDRLMVYGTPWHGEAGLAAPLSGELAAVFFLHHATAPRLVPSTGAPAAARLLSCSFLPFHTAGMIDRTVTAVGRVTQNAPCYDLWFAPDQSAVDIVTSVIESRV